MQLLMERIEIIFKAIFSRNVILIYDIKQRVEGGKLKIVSKTQRHTNLTKFEDIEAMENSIEKIIKKC